MSYYYTKVTGKYWQPAMPFALSVEPSSFCNLECPECPVGQGSLDRPKGFMDLEIYKKLIDEVSPEVFWLNLYFQGEPLMHPDLASIISYANSRKMYTVLSTNGHHLTEKAVDFLISSGLSRIIISLDGASTLTYSRYRKKGDFQRVTSGIRRLEKERAVRRSANPIIILQFLVFEHNEQEISSWKQLGAELGADRLLLKTAQIQDLSHPKMQVPKRKKHSRYHTADNGKLMPRRRGKGICYRSWVSPVITWDGQLVPCCYDKHARHCFGNLTRQNFRVIWKNAPAILFRKSVGRDRNLYPICRNCFG